MDSLADTVSLSDRLISRFRQPLEVTPPFGSPEAKKTKRQKRKDEVEALSIERSRQKELEVTNREANENFNLFPETLKSVTFTEKNTQLTDVLKVYGTRNLPDFDSFQEKVGPSNRTGVVNMAHKSLGDERCIILSTAMIETGMSEDGDDAQAIYSLSLCDNRISDLGMVTVMDNVMLSARLRTLIHLDMSHNKIGQNGAMALAKCVCKLPNLQRLNLSNMNLTDGILSDILFLFCNCQHRNDEDSSLHLKSLILSKNHMRTNAAIALASYLSSANGSDVIELDVSWNSLGIEGGSKLWTVISTHASLVSLDMSWNALGNHNHEELTEKVHPLLELNPLASSLDGEGSLVTAGNSHATVLSQQNPITSRAPDFEVVPVHGHFKKIKKVEYVSATALASVLNVNNILLHLNLSHNAFCAKECDIIGESLRDNHTLLGLHITGNSGRVDSHGYLVSDTKPWPLEAAHSVEPIIHDVSNKKYHNIIRSISPNSRMNFYDNTSFCNRNACWVCGGWQEVEFVYRLTHNDIKKLHGILEFNRNNYTVQRRDKISELFPVHLFTSFDGWQPDRMSLIPPAEAKILTEQAPVNSMCSQDKQESVSVLLKTDPRRLRLPRKPSQSKPSRKNSRRRSSVPSSTMGGHNDPFEDCTEVRTTDGVSCRKSSVTRSTSVDEESDVEVNQSLKLSTNSILIERNKSISTQSISTDASVVDQSELDSTKDNERDRNVLLYDSLNQSKVEADYEHQYQQNLKFSRIANTFGSENGHAFFRFHQSINMDSGLSFEEPVDLDEETILVYRLRRMVPPGKHGYVFSVGYDFETNVETEGANAVIDQSQPNNVKTSVLNTESIERARSNGLSLPKVINTINVPKCDFAVRDNDSEFVKSLPTAVMLRSLLCHPVNPKPRIRSMPTLGNRKKLWNRKESILYKQWLNHQNSYVMECFHCDWKQSSIYALLMGVTNDEGERFEIMNTLKEHYAMLKSVYDYYWATYSVDSNGLSGLGYNEMVRQCNMIGPATGEPDLENLHLLGSQKSHVSGRRRRRSSFPPTGVDVLPNVYNNQENVPNPESDGGRNTGACGTDDTLTGGETSKLTLKSDMKTVTAMSPRGTKAIMAPRSSAMIKQITLHRNFREKIQEESSSDDEGNDDMSEGSVVEASAHLSRRKSKAVERRLSVAEQLIKPSDMSRKRQSIVGGKIIEAEHLPWKSGSPDGSCSLHDIDMVFVSNCMTGQKHIINNKRSLLRFQFLDCIVAVSCIKYLNSKICDTIPAALDFFIGNHIGRFGFKRNDARFIKLILPSKPIDNILKFYLKGLKQAFNVISAPSETNSKVRTLGFSKWIRLCELSEVVVDVRVYRHCFFFSKVQGIVDLFGPLHHPRELQFDEFVEGIARLSYCSQSHATALELEKVTVGLSQEDLDKYVTVATVCQVLKEVTKSFIKNAVRVQD